MQQLIRQPGILWAGRRRAIVQFQSSGAGISAGAKIRRQWTLTLAL